MEPVGKHPYWRPQTAGDRVLVACLGALYVVFYAPLHLLHRLLGWTRLGWVALDLLSLPGKLAMAVSMGMGRRARRQGQKLNALAHTEFVCRLCPAARQATRDPAKRGACAWNRAWNEGRFDAPSDFGVSNYFLQFVGRTDLSAYRSLAEGGADRTAVQVRRRLPPAALWAISTAFWVAVAWVALA